MPLLSRTLLLISAGGARRHHCLHCYARRRPHFRRCVHHRLRCYANRLRRPRSCAKAPSTSHERLPRNSHDSSGLSAADSSAWSRRQIRHKRGTLVRSGSAYSTATAGVNKRRSCCSLDGSHSWAANIRGSAFCCCKIHCRHVPLELLAAVESGSIPKCFHCCSGARSWSCCRSAPGSAEQTAALAVG